MLHKATVLVALCLLCGPSPLAQEGVSKDKSGTPRGTFPTTGILPKEDTGALRFLKQHPEADGRGVLVAIFDTGVDPAAPGLFTTTQGQPKFVDFIDATGSGDIPLTTVRKAKEGKLLSLTDRSLKIDPHWKNPTGEFHLGVKAAYDFFPPELVGRLSKERKERFEIQQRRLEAELREQLFRIEQGEKAKLSRKECTARLKALDAVWKDYQDPGPVFDCVVFHDGSDWRAVVDTDSDQDLADETALTNYAIEHQFATFGEDSRLNFTVNIFDEGRLLSLVTPSGEHGTHVAGIVAAFDKEHPERNGLAPGAQLVSIKIGDSHLGSMETGAALVRALAAARRHHCDLINMSYGEATSVPNAGALTTLFNEIVREQNVIFVASAGNSGPALTTVGAPGGTTSAVIGVGAYVSPQMMDVEYSMPRADSGQAYTWSSRGLTADGDFGVDLFAPGGAIAPIPEYSLQPGRQMNGTSMASPNACGNVALLVSALKHQHQKYSPISVLRSLQATAQRQPSIEDLAQGPGLIQVDRALEYHSRWHAAIGEHVELEVKLPGRHNARGILLREPFECDRIFQSEIEIQPYFARRVESGEKLKFELRMQLVSTADWVQAGDHLLLAGSGDRIPVTVDPTRLEPGVHVAEIQGRDADHPERGPLFRVPVIVTKPVIGGPEHWQTKLHFETGKISRHFLAVPQGANQATLRLKRTSGERPSILLLHAVQLVPGYSFEDHETKVPIGLKSGERFEKSIPVIGGRTLELCLAQYWSNVSSSDIEFEVRFSGLGGDEETVLLPGDRAAATVRVSSTLHVEKCHPQATLTDWDRVLVPVGDQLKSSHSSRDSFWDQQHTSQLLLTYHFEQVSKQKISILSPEFEGLLYESPLDSFRMFVFDEHQRLIHADDSEPGEFSIEKGKYVIQLELRDLDRERLEKFKHLTLIVREPLPSAISVPVDRNRVDSIQGKNQFGTIELAPGEEAMAFLTIPHDAKIPKEARTGDRLTGKFYWTDSRLSGRGLVHPLIVAPAQPTSPETGSAGKGKLEQKPAKFNVDDAELQFWINTLKSLTWPDNRDAIDELVRKILERDPNNLEARVVQLHLLDNENREERLPEIVAAADEVIQQIPRKKLRNYFGTRHDPQTSAEKTIAQKRREQKDALVDALYRKGRALGYMELPEVIAVHPIEDKQAHDRAFTRNFQELARWVETTDATHYLLHIRRDRRRGDFGQALELLIQMQKTQPPRELLTEKRMMIFRELGWNFWADYQQAWLWRKYPQGEVPF